MRIVIILCLYPTPRKVLGPETPGNPKIPGAPLPHLNFARNSPATLSNFESTSLEFCGFLDIANWSDDRITCEIGGELRWLTPTLRRIARAAASHQRLTNSHEPTSKFLKFRDLQTSAADTTDEL